MKKRNFSAEFKRESAQLVVDQNYTVADAAKAMNVCLSTMTRWVKQLRVRKKTSGLGHVVLAGQQAHHESAGNGMGNPW